MNNNFQSFMQNFQRFRSQMQGKDPDKMIQEMMNDGRLSQAQYNQARQRAAQIQKMMGGFKGFS